MASRKKTKTKSSANQTETSGAAAKKRSKRSSRLERSEPIRDPARARASKRSPKKAPVSNIPPTSGEAPPKSERPCSPRHVAFADAYIETGNATESARRAGYEGSDESLAVTGSRLLRNAKVVALLEERHAEPAAKREMSRADLRRFWTAVARGEVEDFEEVTEQIPGGGFSKSVEPARAKLKDRLKASELLGKSRGMFIEKHELKLGVDSLTALVDSVAASAKGATSS